MVASTMDALAPMSSGGSSPLSSLASQSPETPFYLPSPTSQDLSDLCLPPPELDQVKVTGEVDGPPPVKRRKTIERKPRVTRYLDLQSTTPVSPVTCPAEQKPQLDTLLKVLRQKRKIVVIAGAGISVSAGIPDFRSKTGLFGKTENHAVVKASGKHLFDASVYKTDAATTSFHDMVRTLSHLVQSSKPTAFHLLLAKLADEGRLLRLYSQNVDGLDVSLPSLATNVPLNTKAPWPRAIQLHGGLGKMVCQKCHDISDFQALLFEGPQPPSCRACMELDSVRTTIAGKRSHGVGRLRPRIVLYNEHNPDEDAIGAVTRFDLRSRPDALIVVGTSLKVRGVRRIVREMCGVVRGRRDGLTVWINNGAQPIGKDFEGCWDLIVNSESDVVAHLAAMDHLNGPDVAATTITATGEEVDDDQWSAMANRERPQVVLQTPKKDRHQQALQDMTPVDTPSPGEGQPPTATKPDSNRIKVTLKLNPPKKRSQDGDDRPTFAASKLRPKEARTTKAKPRSNTTKPKPKAVAKLDKKISSVFKASKVAASALADQQKKTKSEPRPVPGPISFK